MAIWTVFTGDIVKSTAQDPASLDAIFDRLRHAAAEIESWQDRPVPFARFRGDGWQMAISAHYTFRVAICLRAAVRSQGKQLDTRIGIGVGEGDLSENDLGRSDGPAFVASGHALDAMRRGARFSAPDAALPLRTALPLADRIAQGWTQRQAQVVMGLLAPDAPTQADVAAALGISRQMAQRHAEAAHLDALLEVSALLEST